MYMCMYECMYVCPYIYINEHLYNTYVNYIILYHRNIKFISIHLPLILIICKMTNLPPCSWTIPSLQHNSHVRESLMGGHNFRLLLLVLLTQTFGWLPLQQHTYIIRHGWQDTIARVRLMYSTNEDDWLPGTYWRTTSHHYTQTKPRTNADFYIHIWECPLGLKYHN